jgi:hypothetical protein
MEVLDIARTAACNNRDVDRPSHQADEGDIKSLHGAVPVNGVQNQFTGAPVNRLRRIFRRTDVGVLRARVGVNRILSKEVLLDVNGNDNTLAPKVVRSFGNQLRIDVSAGVDDYLLDP